MDLQPVDLEHLKRQTGADPLLAREVLRLFAKRGPGDLARLKAATGGARREAAHLIVGSARAIGATAVAEAAAAIEAGGGDIGTLEGALADAERFIATYLST